jgi:diguanylate cyclase (GGDEF)-like protein
MRQFERQYSQALAGFQEKAAFWVRWAVLFLAAVTLALAPESLGVGAGALMAVMVAAAVLNLALLFSPKGFLKFLRRWWISLWFDLLLASLLVAFTGGARSQFFYLYFLAIFWAALSGSRRAAVSTAAVSLACYFAVLVLRRELGWGTAGLYDIFFRVFLLSLTAYWAGMISDQQKRWMSRHRELVRLAEDWSKTASDIQSAALFGIGALLSSSKSIEETLGLTLDAVEDILKADRCSILLLDKKTNELVLRAARGTRAGAVGKLRLRSDQGLAGQALRTGQPLNVPDTDREPLFVPSPQGYEKIRSMLVVPLMVSEHRVGVINITSVRQQRIFSERELSAIKLVATYAALALENAGILEEKEREATTDGLTGLHNYRYFQNRLEELAAGGGRLALIWMDLDFFKEYNDTFGHLKGSEVLKRLAGIITGSLGNKEAVVSRYGGDEFAVILPGARPREGLEEAERIRAAIYGTDFSGGRPGAKRISASLGLASLPDDARTPRELVELADQAMYLAKEKGKNRIAHWRKGEIELRG